MMLASRRNLQLPLQQLKFSNYSPFPVVPNPQNQPSSDVSEYDKLCVIGQGNYGTVHKVINRKTSVIYALKTIQEDITIINSTNSGISQEIEILRTTDSPYLVKCYEVFEPRAGVKEMLMEYMEAGTLDSVVRNMGPLPETLIARIAKQLLNGLNYLHQSNIVHLDIKPSNLLVNKEMEVKIGDFGVSRIIGNDGLVDSCKVGTYAYMSPERLDSETFGSGNNNKNVYAGDVWSLGVSLWELNVGHFPFFEDGKKPNWMDIVLVVCHSELPRFPSQASDEFVKFLMCCLEREPTKRWTVSQLLKHPFVCNLQ